MTKPIDRSKFLGGSDSAALLGIAPRSWSRNTPYSLWLDKITPPKERSQLEEELRNKVLRRGKRLEPVVLEMVKEESNLKVLRKNHRYVDAIHPYLACEVDFEFALTADLKERFPDLNGIVTGDTINGEIKTVHPYLAHEWGEEGTNQIPIYYVAQALHNMMVTGRRACLFAALFGADDLRMYTLLRDDKIIKQLRETEILFWNDHVMTKKAPPAMSIEDIESQYPKDAGKYEVCNPELYQKVQALRSIKHRMSVDEKSAESLEQAIKEFMGEAAVLTWQGETVATWVTQETNRLDQKLLAEKHPILVKEFTKPSTSRVFRLKRGSDK
jgi:predicted phage-related endonuclease